MYFMFSLDQMYVHKSCDSVRHKTTPTCLRSSTVFVRNPTQYLLVVYFSVALTYLLSKVTHLNIVAETKERDEGEVAELSKHFLVWLRCFLFYSWGFKEKVK